MTALTREQVEAMLAKATPGPWASHRRAQRIYGGKTRELSIAQMCINPDWEANIALIAAAPGLASALLAAWEERDAAREARDRQFQRQSDASTALVEMTTERDSALQREAKLREALQDIADGMGETELVEVGRYAPAVARKALGGIQ